MKQLSYHLHLVRYRIKTMQVVLNDQSDVIHFRLANGNQRIGFGQWVLQ